MKRWLFYFIGLLTAALGISSIIAADLGAGTWDTVFVGLTNLIGLTTGTWMILGGTFLMFLNAYIAKEKPDFTAFITVFTVGLFIDFYLYIYGFINITGVFERILVFTLGFIILAIGAGTYLQAKFAPNPIDNLMLVVHKRFGLSIAISRLICETSALLLGLLLSGPVSYGTVIVAIAIGPCIQISYKRMEAIYNSDQKASNSF